MTPPDPDDVFIEMEDPGPSASTRPPDAPRPRAAPILVDRTVERAPQPKQTMARPYAPQARLKESTIAPPEDNPLSGWRWFGVVLLNRNLWPRDAASNVVMMYFSGRLRGRRVEDLTGLAPWIFLLLAEIAYLIVFRGDAALIAGLEWASLAIAFFLGYGWSAGITAIHLRRNLQCLPLEEVLLTRLQPADIVQGLSVRPIAVQSAASLIYNILHLGMSLSFLWLASGAGADLLNYAGFVFLLTAIRWVAVGSAIEAGGAFATRAHLCIRNPMVASMRMLIDLVAPLVLLGTAAILLGVVVAIILLVGGALSLAIGPFPALLALLGAGFVLITFGTAIAAWQRSLGSDAMDFCIFNPQEWWPRQNREAGLNELPERELFTPWKPRDPETRLSADKIERALERAEARKRRAQASSPAPRPYVEGDDGKRP
ncbi:MAG: hypothetical protein RLY93_09365 [Sumerlaeia bacterium]